MEYRRSDFALFLLGTILALFIRKSTQQIPPEMWLQMKDVTTEQFIEHFLHKKPGRPVTLPPTAGGNPPWETPDVLPSGSPGISGQIPMEDMLWNEEGSLNAAGTQEIVGMLSIKADECEVKNVSFPIPPHEDPNVIHWPSCVKLLRCSGCCNSDILECAPTMAQGSEVSVMRARYPYPGSEYFEFEGVYPMVFDQHLACECRCRTQPKDCVPGLHEYIPHSCKCRCHNENDALTCDPPKIWKNEKCECLCPEYGRQCFSDEVYSEDECRCVPKTDPVAEDIVYDAISDRCADESCRFGFVSVEQAGQCVCVLGSRDTMEGSLTSGRHQSTVRPGSVEEPEVEIHQVPGHPMLYTHTASTTTTTTARPPRRPRPTRRPRPPRRQSRPARYKHAKVLPYPNP